MNPADLEFDHLGLATKSIAKARLLFEAIGYSVSAVSHLPSQRVNVCFATKPLHPTIELIEAADTESPILPILGKVGSTVYHLCYRTRDLERAIAALCERKFRLLGERFVSGPLCSQNTCFLYNANIGIVEITEERR